MARNTKTIPIYHFAKKCPGCGAPMKLVQKMSCSWLECTGDVDKCKLAKMEWGCDDKFPYTYASHLR